MRLLLAMTITLALALFGVPGLTDDGLVAGEARAEGITGCLTGGYCVLPIPDWPPYDCVQDCDGPPDS